MDKRKLIFAFLSCVGVILLGTGVMVSLAYNLDWISFGEDSYLLIITGFTIVIMSMGSLVRNDVKSENNFKKGNLTKKVNIEFAKSEK